jgi:hypothetical protein
LTGWAAGQLAHAVPEAGVSLADLTATLPRAYHACKKREASADPCQEDNEFTGDYRNLAVSRVPLPVDHTDSHGSGNWSQPTPESFALLTAWPFNVHRQSQAVAITTFFMPHLGAIRAYLTQQQDPCLMSPASDTIRPKRTIAYGIFVLPLELQCLCKAERDVAGLMIVLAKWGRHLFPHPFTWHCPN